MHSAQGRASEVRLEITDRTEAYEGRSFGSSGRYERIRAVARMRIDPLAPANAGIVDLDLAPRSADGMVEYDVDVVILRPADPSRARRVMVHEVVNRGMMLIGMLNNGGFAMGDPVAEGDGFLMRQGYTMVWSGWQSDAAPPAMLPPGIPVPHMVTARFPVARRADGTPVTGTIATEHIFDAPDGDVISLPYPAASLDQPGATLTVRQRTADPRRVLPAAAWSFVDERQVRIERPADMDAGAIYRFEYEARDPVVMGLGFAATRDLIAWLRRANEGNPLAGMQQARGKKPDEADGLFASVITIGGSQSGRYIRDFLWQGFNRDMAGRPVFDGAIPYIAGARRTFTNFRFAEPGRFSRQHEDHDVPGFDFPFAYGAMTDPVTGAHDGILARCMYDDTCPRLFHVDTSAEFWQAGASLIGTGGTASDVAFPENVRAYAVAGGPHAPGMVMPCCVYPANTLSYAPVLRALLVAMDRWLCDGIEPPPACWPRLASGDIVPVETIEPPFTPWARVVNLPISPVAKADWPVYVPAIGPDGNDTIGIRPPQVAAPLGTYLGWNLRKTGFGAGDLAMVFGGYVPFAETAMTRETKDRRPALDELYRFPGDREKAFAEAAGRLVRESLLLAEDAQAMIAAMDQG